MADIEITNLTEVEADFQKYYKKVNQSNRNTIRKYALLIANSAKGILWNNVINWTGNLAGSIDIKSDKSSATIKPDTEYANWIEVGGKGGFQGYHYMEGAMDKHKDAFLRAIQNNLKV